MLDYQYRMLVPLSASSSSDALLHDDQNKFPSGQIFLRQQHTVQIIQLVEGPPPPPRRISSVINDSDASSSFYSSEYSESSASDEDEESACSSYCSSDEDLVSPQCNDSSAPVPQSYSETHSIRMKRILAWRENFSTHLTDSLSGKQPSLLLRSATAYTSISFRRRTIPFILAKAKA
jgi:hypothetical protein